MRSRTGISPTRRCTGRQDRRFHQVRVEEAEHSGPFPGSYQGRRDYQGRWIWRSECQAQQSSHTGDGLQNRFRQ